jgi:hypothetical protein
MNTTSYILNTTDTNTKATQQDSKQKAQTNNAANARPTTSEETAYRAATKTATDEQLYQDSVLKHAINTAETRKANLSNKNFTYANLLTTTAIAHMLPLFTCQEK